MPPGPEKPPADGGAVQRQRGFFGRRSVLESSGAVKPPPQPEPPPKPKPAAEPEAPFRTAPADTKAGRKAARKQAARAAMAARGAATQIRSRRRTGTVALVLVGAAALGVGGAWVADRMTRPACNPALDPACQQASSGTTATGAARAGSVARSGSRFSWGGDSGDGAIAGRGAKPVPGTPARTERSTVRRGGFGAVGRFFSSGG